MTTAPDAGGIRLRLTQLFGIDRRSLATWRVGVGLVILYDLCDRARLLRAHYTDAGVLPRDALRMAFPEPWRFSLHALSGSIAWEAVLFAIAACFALALVFGYRTRIAMAVSWVLLRSVINRNPGIGTGGDVVLTQMLIWGMFLPSGRFWGLDRARDANEQDLPQRVVQPAGLGLMLSVCMVYFFSAIHKSHPIWSREFTALYYGLNIDTVTTGAGLFLLRFPPFLRFVTHATLMLEFLGPLFAFVPVGNALWRSISVFGFITFHLGIATCMNLGAFPYIMIVAWLPFIPSAVWDAIERHAPTRDQRAVHVYYDGDCGFCLRLLRVVQTFLAVPGVQIAPAQSTQETHDLMQANNSWLVRTAEGDTLTRFDAFIYLCRCSPLCVWFAPVLAFTPVRVVGTLIYRAVAANRSALSGFTRWLTPKPLPKPTAGGRFLMGVIPSLAIIYLVIANINAVAPRAFQGIIDPRLFMIGRYTGLRAGWTMFTPFPRKEDGWLVMPATLENGKAVDIFTGRSPVTFDKPPVVTDLYPSPRAWQYMVMLLDQGDEREKSLFPYYLRYFVREWNANHPPEEHVESLVMIWMREITPPPGEPQEPATQTMLYPFDIANGPVSAAALLQ